MLFYQLTFAITWLDHVERFLGTTGRLVGQREDGDLTVRDARRILQVADDASPEVVKAAYKALALKHHPDRGGSTAAMERLNAAYGRLTRGGRGPFSSPTP